MNPLKQPSDSVTVECSCGVPGCKELGWPHEWDPIAAGDNCLVIPPPVHIVDLIADDGTVQRTYFPSDSTPHLVREPYERWGSGYACAECVEVHGG